MRLRYDPIAKTLGANINNTELGTFPTDLDTRRYAALEGVVVSGSFVIRKSQ